MKISIVIRTKDKEKYFDRLIDNIAQQTIRTSEIIVTDNFSSSEQLHHIKRDLEEIKRKYFMDIKIKLIPCTNSEFSHAYSTNLAINNAENELICITNAHSMPTSTFWLQEGMKHFQNQKVAGVSGFFLPHREAAVFGKYDDLMYYLSQKISARPFWCSTINCIIRKSLWLRYPFDESLPKIIPETKEYGGEDYDWSREMTARGFKIILDPSFSVYHSHFDKVDEIRRNVKNYFLYKRLQQKINSISRPRVSSSRVLQKKGLMPNIIEIVSKGG